MMQLEKIQVVVVIISVCMTVLHILNVLNNQIILNNYQRLIEMTDRIKSCQGTKEYIYFMSYWSDGKKREEEEELL